ncbi:MAG: UDP-2,4-diacetamido-2,4,6-trideoxy-beta-L-altropyranose hydrolase [Aestuariibacter sp.]
MRVVFRVDAGFQSGTGHLMRCLALAQWLEEYHVECLFVVTRETTAFCQARHDWVGQIIVIPENLTQTEEIDWIRHNKLFTDCDAIVLDGYQFDHHYRGHLHKLFPNLILFDDLQDQQPLYADVVVNGADGVSSEDYQHRAKAAVLCLGREYRIFRKEFALGIDIPWQQRHSITLSMGGTDPNNLTVPLLQAIARQDHSIPVRILCGSGFRYLDALHQQISVVTNPVQLIQNCQDVADIFCHTRLAVAAAGSTQFELLQCATPAVLVVVAENQRKATEAASLQKWCLAADSHNWDIEEFAKTVTTLFHDENKLSQMHQNALTTRVENSTQNTIDAILKRIGRLKHDS